MDRIVFDLSYPISDNGREIKTITLRRPKVADLLAMDGVNGGVAKSCKLISNLGEISPKAVHDIDASDFSKIQAEMDKHFFG